MNREWTLNPNQTQTSESFELRKVAGNATMVLDMPYMYLFGPTLNKGPMGGNAVLSLEDKK